MPISSNKSFGLTFGIIFFLIFLYLYFLKDTLQIFLLSLSLIFFLLGFFNSKILTPLNFCWLKFGDYLNKIFSPCIMFLIYFFVIYLTKIFLFLFRKDILAIKFKSPKAKMQNSYWNLRKNTNVNMDEQF